MLLIKMSQGHVFVLVLCKCPLIIFKVHLSVFVSRVGWHWMNLWVLVFSLDKTLKKYSNPKCYRFILYVAKSFNTFAAAALIHKLKQQNKPFLWPWDATKKLLTHIPHLNLLDTVTLKCSLCCESFYTHETCTSYLSDSNDAR